MSGTASIGSCVKFHTPRAAIPIATIITSQRWRIEKATIASIMRPALRHLAAPIDAQSSSSAAAAFASSALTMKLFLAA
jgi:hypothetical protein